MPFPPATYSSLKHGSSVTMQWSDIETSDQVFNWTGLDQWLTRVHSYGWHSNVGFEPQSWTTNSTTDKLFLPSDLDDPADEGVYYITCTLTETSVRIPRYWGEEYQNSDEATGYGFR